MEVKGYFLANPEKIDRALNGFLNADNKTVGGVGRGAYREEGVWKRDGAELNEKEVEELETALLAEYDKFAGLIKKGDDKVKTGSFFDFTAKQARKTPKVSFIYKVNGKFVEVEDGIELPGEVKAVKVLGEIEKKKKIKKS